MNYAEMYELTRAGSLRSARVVVPRLVELVQPHSVVDVGCGEGWWLSVFRECGVERITGFDGAHVSVDRLWIPQRDFVEVDLQRDTLLGDGDLVISFEVAEHLPATEARRFVEMLVRTAPVVAFSAAMPHQGGVGHVNEQWPRYWWDLFAERGYVGTGALRWALWDDERIEHWYRQLFLYASPDAIAANECLRALVESPLAPPWPVIHPNLWEHRCASQP